MINGGLEAAKKEDWKTAVAYFQSALQYSPFDPAAIFNLALASDKLGNNDIKSLAWYRAYLILKPDAQNREAVQRRIQQLDELVLECIRSFIGQTEDAVKQIPSGFLEGWDWKDFWLVVEVELSLGDTAEAVRLSELIPPDSMNSADFSALVKAVAEDRGIEEARRFVERKAQECKYSTRTIKNDGLAGIAMAQLSMGDLTAAEETVSEIDDAYEQSSAAEDVVGFLLEAPDTGAALRIAQTFGLGVRPYVKIIKAQAASGDKKAAKNTLKTAEELAWKVFNKAPDYSAITTHDGRPMPDEFIEQFKGQDEYSRYSALAALAEGQAAAGESAAAKKIAERIEKDYQPKDAAYQKVYKPGLIQGIYLAMVAARINSGNPSAAEKLVSLLNKESQYDAYAQLARAWTRAGKFDRAEDAVSRIAYLSRRMEARSYIAEEKGDLARAKVYKIYALGGEDMFSRMEEFRELIYSLEPDKVSEAVSQLTLAIFNMSEVLNKLRQIGP